jgi:thiol-disulfide isomerase/thioredoxin
MASNNLQPISLESVNFIQGEQFNIENNKYYVLEFWATWCPPCVRSIPHLNELYIKYKNCVNFVGITSGDNDQLVAFINLKSDNMTYPVANDPDNIVHDRLNISGIPQMFILHGHNIIWSGHPLDKQVEVELNKILLNRKDENELVNDVVNEIVNEVVVNE